MIVINTKNYKTGKPLLKLAKLIEKYLPKAIIAVPIADIEYIKSKTKLKVYAQHVDLVKNDKSTGFISAKSVKADGAQGTILNHSEHRLQAPILQKTIVLCKKNKLHIIVCVKDLPTAKLVKSWKPYAIAFEEPSLIATGKSITTTMPKVIQHFATLLKGSHIIPICGAGISTAEDVRAAYKLGCRGVLIASAIANNKNPIGILKELRRLK